MPQVGHMCEWMSTRPGMIVFPLTSMTVAPGAAGPLPVGPTETIRLSRTTKSPFSMTWSPFMVTIRAPRSTTVPRGTSRGTRMVMSSRFPS